MQNDMGEGLPPLGANNLEKVKSLWNFQVSRAKAENWAFRDMRFLVYDESMSDYDSDDEDAMIRRALRMSTEVDNEDPQPLPYRPQKYGADFECRICSSIPEFPADRKTRHFRLFRPADILPTLLENRATHVDVCTHYVAVSYCWPKEKISVKGGSWVRDLNGEVRRARALDDVLDRAVDFANSCGLRMIWIDQECLPQPRDDSPQADKDYQRLGVQAMDIVYNKAAVTAGLHSGTIETQQQADAIRMLVDFDKHRIPVPDLSRQFFDRIFGFLHMVRLDRWYTRTWVIQEAVSAGESLVLAFRRGKGVQYPSAFRVTGRSQSHRPKHSLDSESSRFASELILIHVNEFRGIVRAARTLLQRPFAVFGEVLSREDPGQYPTLDIAESLHPKISPSNQMPIQLYGGNQYGRRQRVNASTALTFLKGRECTYQEDRITVVANMCGYEIRLDASEIAKNCDSVRIGILALALLNGDMSILVPEVYAFPDNHVEETNGLNRALLSPFDTDPGTIADYTMMKGYLQIPRICKHALGENLAEGLRLSAYIWTVESELDCFPLKVQFAELWHSLKCLAFRVDRLKDESEDDYHQRAMMVRHHFSVGGRMDAAKEEILRLGYLPRDSIVWAGLDPTGIDCFAHLDAARVQNDPRMRGAVAEVFFGILLYLKSHPDPQATGLANSIWQSIRVDMVDKERPDLPDEVNDALFNHHDVLHNPFKTLKLDKTSMGGFRQTWFIDRIMLHGALWIGRYQRAPVFQPNTPETMHESPKTVHDSPETVQDLPEMRPYMDPPEMSQGVAGSSSSQEREVMPGRSYQEPLYYTSEIPLTVEYEGVSLRDVGEETILHRQLRLHMTTTMKSLDMFMRNENDVSPNFNAGSMTYFLDAQRRGIWTDEAEEARVQDLVATFDVDGPCTVATPYNSEWEVLPHPDLRAMSACWVVEPVNRSKKRKRSASDVGAKVEEPDARSKEKGKEKMEPAEAANSEENPQSKGKGKEKMKLPEEPPEVEMPGEVRLMREFEEWSKQVPLYRVVHKVKGLWRLMDLPLQEFCFI